MIIEYIFFIAGLSYLLGHFTDLTTRSLRRLNAQVRVNEFIASFFFLGIATSIPELAVALFSAAEAVPELSLGNLLGANIVVLTLMMGVMAILAGKISIRRVLRPGDFWLTLGITGLPIPLIIDGQVSRIDGVILLTGYGLFLLHFYLRRRYYQRLTRQSRGEFTTLGIDTFRFISAVVVLLVTSYFLVRVSLTAAVALGMPLLVVGLLMISLGTNLPEVTFVANQVSARHARDKHIALGILLGNVVFNTPILGILALLRPFTITDRGAVGVTVVFLSAILAVFGYLMLSQRTLTRREGVGLVVLYIIFVAYQTGLLGLS
ncbi:MAG: hypothetical protein WEA04_03885 [Candidatus Andersenbacteria bacterium]